MMNDEDHNSNPDPNPYWDYVEPECRWIPQCHRLLIPGSCDQCDFVNPDLPRNEDGEPYSIQSARPADLISGPTTQSDRSQSPHIATTLPPNTAPSQEPIMNRNPPPGGRKLFLVPRTATPFKPPEQQRHRLPKLANNALIPLAVIFLAVVTLAGYLCLHGNWN